MPTYYPPETIVAYTDFWEKAATEVVKFDFSKEPNAEVKARLLQIRLRNFRRYLRRNGGTSFSWNSFIKMEQVELLRKKGLVILRPRRNWQQRDYNTRVLSRIPKFKVKLGDVP